MSRSARVVGIDASGPANHAGTAMCVLAVADAHLDYASHHLGLSDRSIVNHLAPLVGGGPLVVGIDAPLSYGDQGGDRPADKALRTRVRAAGLASGSVMAPTSPRMAYLTLRGIALARALQHGGVGDLRIVEVHPGAALALGGADVATVRQVKAEPDARVRLVAWLRAEGLRGLPSTVADTDHEVMAAAAAWAAWRWASGRASWSWPASPPGHPFEFAC